jgi:archaellum biogenesis ATPase FlaH
MAMKLTIKGVKRVDKKSIGYTVESDTGLKIEDKIVVSVQLMREIKKIEKAEKSKKAKSDDDQFDLAMDFLELVMTEDNYEYFLDYIAENTETTEEEVQAIGDLISLLVQKVLPKAQSSTPKE